MFLCWEMKEILQCPACKLETRSMFMRFWGKGLDQDWCNTACRGILLLPLPLYGGKWTLLQNQLSKAGVKLVAKGSAGNRTASNSRSCSPLPWFAQAAHRWQHPHWCSHQWKQMAVGSSACSQPDGPSVHFTEALCHHSSFSFHLHIICLLVYHGGVFYPAEQKNDCMHSWSSYILGHGFASYTRHCSLPECQLTDMPPVACWILSRWSGLLL